MSRSGHPYLRPAALSFYAAAAIVLIVSILSWLIPALQPVRDVVRDHFVAVASNVNITVTITPLSADSKGLAVVAKSAAEFSVRELMNGTGSYEFDYMISAVRIGHENYEVIRNAVGPDRIAAPTSETERE